MIVRPSGWQRAVRGQIEHEMAPANCTKNVGPHRLCGSPAGWAVYPIEQKGKMPTLFACDLHLVDQCMEAARIEDAVPVAKKGERA